MSIVQDVSRSLPSPWPDRSEGRARALIGRREILAALFAAPFLACDSSATSSGPVLPPSTPLDLPPLSPDALLDDLERRSFDYFWETTDPATGLTPDRWPTPSFCSIAAVGFGLTAYVIGVERGYVTREQARARVLATVRTFHDAPQGDSPTGVAGHKGFFYHFLDMRTGTRFGACELSTVDTALLLAGMLHCQTYFDGADADESLIRQLVDDVYGRVDWPWAQARPPWIGMGWSPEAGFIQSDWKGYTEASLVYLLAMGSPTYPLGPEAWAAWTSTYESSPVSGWVTEYGQTYLRFPPLFGHQFTQCWVDLRDTADPYMQGKGIDYFENSRRATYAQQGYAISNPHGWAGYGRDIWGVTACDGPADVIRVFGGSPRRFIGYSGRGMGGPSTYDDGTIAPYAAGASVVFTPEISLPALAAMHDRYGQAIYGRYGFLAFNQSFTFTDVRTVGRVIPGFGWVDGDWLGIEVGPLLAMIANLRGDTVWKTMRQHPAIKLGLQRAGFSGGWIA
jgi:hypothetical protein